MATPIDGMKIKVREDGPYDVAGNVPLMDLAIVADDNGESVGWQEGATLPERQEYSLCRCGNSQTKPYCDGSHLLCHFDGRETASRETFEAQADPKTKGPELELTDVPALCAAAGFCTRAGGVWDNVERSDEEWARNTTIQETCDCPSGRLVLRERDGKVIEPELEPGIGLVLDKLAAMVGPLWVRGGIPVESSDGHVYEIRNRITLCRCGRSTNKPFCDGQHLE